MKIKLGDQFKCTNPDILSGYYDGTFNGEILTVTYTKLPKVRNLGGSSYFAIFEVEECFSKLGHSLRFSVSLDKITKQNFIKIKN